MMSGVVVMAIAGVVAIGGVLSTGDLASADTLTQYTYIADSGNDRVLKVAPDGTQTTVGSDLVYPYGVAVDGSGIVYIADPGSDRVLRIGADGTQTSVGSDLYLPFGVAVDGSGNVYIADSGNSRVLKVAPSGMQTTVGTDLNLPAGVAVDRSGNVYIADTGKHQVYKVAPNGTQTSVGSTENVAYPSGVAVDGSGNVFITDLDKTDVLKVAPSGTEATIGSGLREPWGVAVDESGAISVAVPDSSDSLNSRVVKFGAGGTETTIGSGLKEAFGVAVGASVPLQVSGLAPAATVGAGYSFTYNRQGIPLPTVSVTSGTLPPGLALSKSGVLSGIPTTTGTFTFTITATNGIDPNVALPVTLTVNSTPTLTGTPPAAMNDVAYTYPFTLTGQPTPTASVTSGTLPPGLALSKSGVLSGTPTTTGTFTFTITATNGVNPDATLPVTMDVNSAPTLTGTPPAAINDADYTYPFTTTGFPAPTVSVTSGALPAGLTLSTDGILSGTPTETGTFDFTLTATNGIDPDATLPVTMDVNSAPTLTGTPPAAMIDADYTYDFDVTGYPASTVSVTSGTLPPGLTLSTDGILSGTPTETGTFDFTLTATNGIDPDATLPASIDVDSLPTLTGTPPAAVDGVAYTYPFTTTGHPLPTVFVISGALPPGLTLTDAGVLSGTPTQTGTFAFTLMATNGVERLTTLPVTMDVNPAPNIPWAPLTPPTTPPTPPNNLATTGSNTTPWAGLALGLLLAATGTTLIRKNSTTHKRTPR
ncbi:NHL repeat-containing protein [Microbacterium rhizomatis]|nr:NHL repeat-containing protein [Microbacterium rhizomatis]